jgi:cell division protein FtsQ
MSWLKNIAYVILVGGLAFLLGFTEQQQEALPCAGVKIQLNNEVESFVTRGEVIHILNSIVDSLSGLPTKELPLYEMEKTIEQHGLIEDAEVFVLPSGELQVELTQKKPIVRVQNISDNEFYVTMDGNPFPLSRNYTQRVLIANGHIADSVDVAQVTKLSRYIVQDAFWKSQIIQVYLNENKEFELIPRVGNHTILLGGLEEMEEKFEKLMLFYQKGVQQTGWNNYSLINLKYKNQLVCVKR